jgi:hypothetical protein
MSNKVIKPVSFNITKGDDALMLAHVKRKNFSGYVKKLIMADIKNKEKGSVVIEPKEDGKLPLVITPLRPSLDDLKERIKLASKDINKGTDTGTNSSSN